jgi:hypothetical protein
MKKYLVVLNNGMKIWVEAGSETEAIMKICDRVVAPCKEIIEKIGISRSKEERQWKKK